MRPLHLLNKAVVVVCSLFTATAAFPQDRSPMAGFGGNPPDIRTSPTSLLAEARRGMWLVEAKCLSVSPPREFNTRWSIDHVFSGPEELTSKTFEFSPQLLGNLGGSSLRFVPRVGEEAVWVVQLQKQVVTLSTEPYLWSGVSTRSAYGVSFPVAQFHLSTPGAPPGLFSQFDEALSYAQSVERVAKAERAEQLPLLQLYAKSPMPARSAWAILTLAQSGAKGTPKFLLDLTNDPQISGAGLLALQQGLYALDEDGQVQWNASPARLALWHRMVTSAQDEGTNLLTVGALLQVAQIEGQAYNYAQGQHEVYTPSLSGEQLFELFRLASVNTKWTPQARALAVKSIGQLNRDKLVSRGTVWTYLLPLLQSHPDFATSTSESPLDVRTLNTQLAQGALGSLFDLKPLTQDERATLHVLQQRAKSPRLKRGLDDLLIQEG